MDGMHVASLAGAAVVALAAVLVWRLLPRYLPPEAELAEDLFPMVDGELDGLLDEVVPVPG